MIGCEGRNYGVAGNDRMDFAAGFFCVGERWGEKMSLNNLLSDIKLGVITLKNVIFPKFIYNNII